MGDGYYDEYGYGWRSEYERAWHQSGDFGRHRLQDQGLALQGNYDPRCGMRITAILNC